VLYWERMRRGHVAQCLGATCPSFVWFIFLCKNIGVRGFEPGTSHNTKILQHSNSHWAARWYLITIPIKMYLSLFVCGMGKGGGPGLKPRPLVLLQTHMTHIVSAYILGAYILYVALQYIAIAMYLLYVYYVLRVV
jgi:hypothetical protein